MTVATAVGAGTRLRAVSRLFLGWGLALALCAFAVTSSSGPLEVPSAGTFPSVGVAHDLVVGFGEHHAAETRVMPADCTPDRRCVRVRCCSRCSRSVSSWSRWCGASIFSANEQSCPSSGSSVCAPVVDHPSAHGLNRAATRCLLPFAVAAPEARTQGVPMRSPSQSGAALIEPIEAEAASAPPSSVKVHPFRFDPTISIDVPVVRWPDQSGARAEFRRRHVPCVLVVGPTDPAPRQWGELEDWIRAPVRDAELAIRRGHRRPTGRHPLRTRPRLPRALSFRGRTVVLPASQRPIVARMLERRGEVVSDAELCGWFRANGASTHAEAVKTALRRIKRALAPVGLQPTRVRGAGYLLDRAP